MRKFIIVTVLLSFASSILWSSDLSKLKASVSQKNQAEIESILESASPEDLSEYENYILSEAKAKVLKGEHEEAAFLVESILSVDFENKAAQDLYTSIEKAKKEKKKVEKETKEKIAQDKAAEEEAYWEKIKTTSFMNFPLSVGITPVALNIQTSSLAVNKSNMRYGLGFNLGAGYIGPNLKLNLKANYDTFPVALSGKGTLSNLNLRTSISASRTDIPIALTAGFKSRKSNESTSLYTDLSGAFIGAGLDGYKFKNIFDTSIYFDWNLCSYTADTLIDFSCGTEITIRYKQPLKKNNNIKWYVENCTRFDYWKIKSNSETCTTNGISAGVIINGR